MLIVKDSMVLIHLAKTSLLKSSCSCFGNVIIPEEVFRETVEEGMSRGYGDAMTISNLIKEKAIAVKKAKDAFVRKANQFNIQRGEAEAVALYWQEKADMLATDDDNVRIKKAALGINMAGTPAIILTLHKKGLIKKEKVHEAVKTLRKIGWFSGSILDSMLMEVG
ncbi:MAG: hypothetical protein HY518_05695 [Candidatus Aenigmarchaeota archaeon]|nr:hypothetical protein [Candidatus Aenigmarchaeota archaeon]